MITVLGAGGFIGSRLVAHLQSAGIPHRALGRADPLTDRPLGDVIDCVGLTADFRTRPHDAVEAHVSRVNRLVREGTFDSFVYLSSTRVYGRDEDRLTREEDGLRFQPADFDDLYGLSKAMGEAVVLAGGDRTKVVRLSNVYGDDTESPNFLPTILKQALAGGPIELNTSMESTKDYVSVGDVVAMITRITLKGRERIYNVASGQNTSNAALVGAITSLTGTTCRVDPAARTVSFPTVDVSRLRDEFDFQPADVLADLPAIIAKCRSRPTPP